MISKNLLKYDTSIVLLSGHCCTIKDNHVESYNRLVEYLGESSLKMIKISEISHAIIDEQIHRISENIC